MLFYSQNGFMMPFGAWFARRVAAWRGLGRTVWRLGRSLYAWLRMVTCCARRRSVNFPFYACGCFCSIGQNSKTHTMPKIDGSCIPFFHASCPFYSSDTFGTSTRILFGHLKLGAMLTVSKNTAIVLNLNRKDALYPSNKWWLMFCILKFDKKTLYHVTGVKNANSFAVHFHHFVDFLLPCFASCPVLHM